MSLPVIFRKFSNGSVLALFPTEPAGEGSLDTACCAFSVHGKSYADIAVVNATTQATADDYVPMLLNMVRAGYTDLTIVKRVTAKLNEERLSKIKSHIQTAKKAA